MPVLLSEFIAGNRADILHRCNTKMTEGSGGRPPAPHRERGIPEFVDQLVRELSTQPWTGAEMAASALQHGNDVFADGLTIKELVHDYGSVCQSITDLAVETNAQISTADFRTLNRCLDNAIADAVSEYANQVRAAGDDDALRVRSLVYIIETAFDVLREGKVGVAGASGDLVARSLRTLSALVNAQPN